MYRKRRYRYRHRNTKLKKLAMIGISAAVVIGAFLALLGFVKQNNESNTSSGNNIAEEETSSDSETVPVTDTAEPEKITLVSSEVTTEKNVKLPDEIRQLLLDYTSDKYEYTGELEYKSLSQYFNTDNTYGKLYAGFCNTSLQYLIYERQSHSADLRYD